MAIWKNAYSRVMVNGLTLVIRWRLLHPDLTAPSQQMLEGEIAFAAGKRFGNDGELLRKGKSKYAWRKHARQSP